MTAEERRTVTVTAVVLLVASLARFAWEARPLPPLLPPEAVPEELIQETRVAVEMEERRRTPLAPGERVDPNRASEVELSRLPGIGPATANRILANRDAEGPFRRSEDLLRVQGIGPATLERIRGLLDLDDPPDWRAGPGPVGGLSSGPREGPPPSPSILPDQPVAVDVNRAGPEELTALPGIGPALAARIVDHRRRNGPFRTPEDLLEVSGIGPATLERLRPMIRLGR
jgi:competence protein ComEA